MTDAEAARAVISRLAAELLGDRDAIVSTLVDRVHADPAVPGDDELRAATAAAGDGVVSQLLTGLRDGGSMAAVAPPPAALVYAHEFAHRGIELQVLLAVVRAGYAEFSRLWSQRLTDETPPSTVAIRALSNSLLEIFAYVDAISAGFAVAYSRERERWSRSIDAIRLDAVRAIIAGEPVDPELAARRLRHRLDVTHRALLVWSDGEPALGLRDALESAIEELSARAGAATALVVPLSGQVLAGWLSGPPARCQDERLAGAPLSVRGTFDVRAALGCPAEGIEGFRSSHAQAVHARRVARRWPGGVGRVTPYAAVALTALASSDVDHARDFVLRELGALAGQDRATRRIAATVQVFLEEGRSRARTSRRLGLHTNTIAYRLQRGAELLGHPLDERSTEVQVALMLMPVTSGE